MTQSPTRQQDAALLALLLEDEAEQAAADNDSGDDSGDGGALPSPMSPMSFSQQRLWFLLQYEPGSTAYNQTRAFRLHGRLDRAALAAALRAVVDRHPALRTRFAADGAPGQPPRQVVERAPPFALGHEPLAAGEAALRARIDAEAARAFDLCRAPLLRATLLARADDEHVLLLSLHHIVSDAVSNAVIARDLATAYAQAASGAEVQLPPPAATFAAHARRQRERLDSGALDAQRAWWQASLGSHVPALQLPVDRPHGAPAARHLARRVDMALPPALAGAVRAFCVARRCTPFVVMLAAWQALLARHAGQHDFAIGVPHAGRGEPGLDDVVGFFANTHVYRSRTGPGVSAGALCERVRADALGALANAELPFEVLLDSMQVPRDAGRSPLFQVMFNLRAGAGTQAFALPGLRTEAIEARETGAKFDLILDVETHAGTHAGTHADSIHISLEYDSALFDAATAQRLARHYVAQLDGMLRHPELPLTATPLLDADGHADDRAALAMQHAAGQPRRRFAGLAPAHRLIQRQAEARPDAVALRHGDATISYGELERRANRLAHRLIALGVGPEVRVGIAAERSPEMIVGLLAILKAGGAYVPFDPAYPAERLAYLFDDSGIAALLAQPALQDLLPRRAGLPVVLLDAAEAERADWPEHAPDVPVRSDHLAYVIYTSGSTGRPKGAQLQHGNLSRLLAATQDWFGFGQDDVWTLFHSYAFDFSVWEIFGALCHGGQLVIVPFLVSRAPQDFLALLRRERVTVLNQTPSAFRALLAQPEACAQPLALRHVIFGGEALEPQALRPWLERFGDAAPRLVNMYGITETTVHVTFRPVTLADLDPRHGARSPIGECIPDLGVRVLDASLNPVPPGVAGELYVGGDGLARGYLNRPGLTAERFVPDPFSDGGARLYRSGDLARWLPDGQLEYLGRIDQQLKIRGFRIEPGEIEARLLAQAGIANAAVIAVEGPTGARLAAYVVPAEGCVVDVASLRAALAAQLPDYMVPAAFVVLAALPLTPNGKLNRHALPAPEFGGTQAFVAPAGEAETALAAIWAEVLGLPRVGRADNFFELGGDSILSLQIVARARAAGWLLTPRQLFERQTLAELATVAQPLPRDGAAEEAVPTGAVPLLPIQADFFAMPMERRGHWNQSVLLDCREAPDTAALSLALGDLVAHHDALRLRFSQADGAWVQTYADAETAPDLLWVREFPNEAERIAHCEAAQRSLDLAHGPLLRAVALHGAAGQWQLLLVVHHLVIDGVSWRILIEDLLTAYRQRRSGQPAALPARTASCQRWSEALRRNTASRADELPHWLALSGTAAELPCDDPSGSLTVAERDSLTLTLPADATQALLQHAPAAYRTRINDLLLTALARVLSRWSGNARTLIDLESHGRVAGVDDALDLSRTVGWFTTLFPVALDGAGMLPDAIKAVKEQLRAVPGEGIGFGLLRRFGTAEQQAVIAALPKPEVVFNYLGQFDASLAEGAPWQPAFGNTGASQDASAPLSHPLSVSGQVHGGELRLSFAFSRARHRHATVQRLAEDYRAELLAVIAHCASNEAAGFTPSDFPLARLSQAQLDGLGLDPAQVQDLYPLSPMQAGMLFHSVYAPAGSAYTNQLRVDIDGLDATRFAAAWHAALARHDSLRCGFLHRGEQPLQWVARHVTLPVVMEDWSDRDAAQCQRDLDQLAVDQLAQGFDLERPPLMRVALIRTGASRHHLLWTVHHLLLDGWSTSQLLGEVLRHYAGETLPATGGRFADYIGWLQGRDADASRAFWSAQLAALDTPTRLMAALPAPEHGEGHAEQHHTLDADRTAALAAFARAQKVTLNTLVQAAWLLLLQRYTGQDCVAFGATVAGRPADLPGSQQMLGLFINTLPVIATPRPEQAVGDWLREVQALNLATREHEHTPLYEIQRWAGQGGQALFDAILVFENYPVDAALRRAPGGLAFSDVRNRAETNYPLTLVLAHTDTLRLTCRFDRALLGEPHAADLSRALLTVMAQMSEDAARLLGGISLVAPAERPALLTLGRNPQPYPAPVPVHRLFEARAASHPEAVALVFGARQLGYAELNRRANRLAHRLIARGVGPDVPVGVLAERSVEMVVALLAILKAGGAYVPFDPDYPAERLAYMIGDSGVALLLAQRADLLPTPPRAVEVIDLTQPVQETDGADHDPAPVLLPDHLAYVIYTSGSTGRPKGVGNRHGALHNRLWWMQAQYGLGARDTVLQKTPFSFDVSVWEFFWPLMTGARLVLAAPGDHRDPARIAALIARHGVTTLHFVPAMLQAFVAHDEVAASCATLRHIVCSGEALPAALARRAMTLLPYAGLHNLYGPTEAAIDVTHWTCRDDGGSAVPIGSPIANVDAHVLDGALHPLPDGVAGELYLGGAGLARGYLGRAALTAERFVADPHGATGERLYRTGDLARRRADGQIAYLGRLDHQVKIRGLRIELGEIEARLLAHPGVREAVVVAPAGEGPARLAAYVVGAAGASPDVAELRAWLAQALPDYMVPAALLVLEAMPVSANGKLDRRALPSPEFAGSAAFAPPAGAAETQLAEAWARVLKVARVGRADNFFELGGDSILSLQIVARMRGAGWLLTPKQLFEQQTLAAVAAALVPLAMPAASAQPAPRAAAPRTRLRSEDFPLAGLRQDQLDALQAQGLAPAEVEDLYPLSPMQAGMLYHSASAADGGGAYVNQLRVDIDGLDAARFALAWRAALARHDTLRSGFLQRGEQPLQWVAREVELPVTHEDWSARAAGCEPALDRFAADDLARGFDLERPPLMRLALIRTGPRRHHLVWTVHHLLLDGWSTAQLLGEVLRHYAGEAVPAAADRFADYIGWLQGRDAGAAQAFWSAQLRGFDTPTRLAEAVPAPDAGSGYGLLQHECDTAQTARLAAFARAQKVTVNTLVQAAWLLLLQRYTGQRRVAFGATVAGRPAELPGSQQMLGLFINTLPVIAAPRPEQAVGDWLRELQGFNLAAREHEHTPLSDIQRWGGQPGQRLFDSILVFENFPLEDALAPAARSGLAIETRASTGLTEYEMDVEVSLRQTLRLGFTYMRRAFDEAQVERIRAQLLALLEAISTRPGQALGSLGLLAPRASAELLALGQGEAPPADGLAVHQHIARHAAARPDAIAVICGDQTLRYGELLARADRLAAVLHARGIGAENRVGIALSRSPDILVALLAVMRSGAAYVPFDPAYPPERLAYLFGDSAIALLVTETALLDTLPAPASLPVLTLDMVPDNIPALPEQPVHRDQLAYLIYTSGSTGQPKGVCVSHGPLAMHVAATIDAYEMGAHSRELHFLSFAFDGAHERWLCALACGGSLVLRDDTLWTPEQTCDALIRHRVTNAGFPPAYLKQLAEWCAQSGQRPEVSLYSFGGEAMPRPVFELARRALAPRTFINGYGPTETVVTPMVWKVRADSAEADFAGTYAPIGRPVGARCAYLLDAELNLVPPGVAGELYLGSEGLARGYLNRPGMTAERFVPDPFSDGGARLYRSGDLARWLPDGQLEYLGRIDQQLKIRGFRIEPGEIEARLLAQDGVANAAVIAVDGPNGARLAAYVVPAEGCIVDVASLRAALAAQLPDYMVPAAFVALAALPLTPNGKLDRRALPTPAAEGERPYVAPRTEAQRWLAQVWQEVLGVERVGLDDHFFELGGDSLLSLKVISRVRANKALGLALKLRDLMRTPTIGELLPDAAAAPVAGATPPAALRVLAQGPAGAAPAPLCCVHAALGTLFDYDEIARRLGAGRAVYGLQSRMLLDPDWRDASLEAMARDYVRELRAARPQGPYLLLGWSLGATLATLMARELEAQGQQVQWLVLVDPFVPQPDAGATAPAPRWRAALADFARRMLPHAPPLPMPASADVDMDAEPDAAAVRALLAPLMAGAPARQQALGADELAQMFLAAHRLGTLAGALRALPPVRAPLAVWWRAGRAGAAARLAQWQGAPLREAVLDGVDHHAIVRDARLVEALAALAPDRQAPGNATAGGAGNGMQTTTLLTE